MDQLTVKALMEDLGCEKYPERWADFFDEVAAKHSTDGCLFARPEHYDYLSERYHVLEKHKDIYKKAAEEIAKKPELSLFLALLCRALEDRALIRKDIASLSYPKAQEGEDPMPYNMLTGLAMCQAIPSFYEDMKKRGMPDDIIYATLRLPEESVDSYRRKHSGEYGFANFDWYQLYYDHRLIRIEGLSMEFPAGFPALAQVFKNRNGELVTLASNVTFHKDGYPLGTKHYEDAEDSFTASIEETDESFTGYPYGADAIIAKEKISLKKSEWVSAVKGGDRMISIHIPTGAKFTPADVDRSLDRTREILKNCYPEYDYKIFFCGSWMLDPQLPKLIGEEKNISKFCRRFNSFYIKDSGTAVFGFVFQKPNSDFEISSLPENTSLERALKHHYLDGKAIYQAFGIFLA